MADYYDKEKFTGGDGKKKGESWNWVVLILLFCTGLWPLALLWMGFKWLTGGKEKPEEKIRRAQEKMDSAIDSALRGVADAGEAVSGTIQGLAGALSGGAEGVHRPAEEPKAAAKPAERGKKVQKPRSAVLKKLEATANSGVFLQFLGAVFLFGGVMMLSSVLDDAIVQETLRHSIEELVLTVNVLLAGGLMAGWGNHLHRFSRRSRKYLAAVGESDSMSVALIARRVGRSPRQAARDLQKMIDRGYFGEDAYLDLDLGYFLRFGSDAERRRTAPAAQEEAPPAPPKEAEEGYSGVLRRIRAANDRIADPELSGKIERLEQITGQILKEVDEHPEKRSRMNTFFDYYLPTTQKLLDAYADFEETGVEGENLRAAKQRIEQTMDTIVDGFAHQLDELYKTDALDITSDIKVMESMLHRDASSAAKDFGYDHQQGQN